MVKWYQGFFNVYLQTKDVPEAEYQKPNFWIIRKETDHEKLILRHP